MLDNSRCIVHVMVYIGIFAPDMGHLQKEITICLVTIKLQLHQEYAVISTHF